MIDLTAMVLAEDATREHVLSARPTARVRRERSSPQRGEAMRRLMVTVLRRLADRLEPVIDTADPAAAKSG
ncbi:hypothetical protein, partial [Asanoa siamensis]|uniref:hypothetical protein n=1 Tax=Asanoa siamensis TaxID=926357 RepID=UPI00194171BA